jgi:hypothetical protein
MFILRRLVILSTAILLFLQFELVNWQNGLLWPAAVIFLLYLFFACFTVCGGKCNKVFWYFLILPVCFAAVAFAFVLFLVNDIAFHATAVLCAGVLYLLLRQYFVYFFLPLRYQAYSLENLNFYITLVTSFFLFSSGFASVMLLQLNLALVALIIAPIFVAVLCQFFWIHKVNLQKGLIFVLPICLVALEVFVALAYLPTSYYVDAFVMVAVVYVMLGLSRLSVQNIFERKRIWSYLAVGFFSVLLVLLTAKWG